MPSAQPAGSVATTTAAMHHGRDPVVDLVRAMAVSIVVVWHTTLSVVHVDDGRLVMGSPIDAVAGGWVATWLLQVMPAFFVVGGYVHLGAWRSASSIGAFLRRRAHRLGRPLRPLLVMWALAEVALLLAGRPPVAVSAPGMLTLLWFLPVYAATTALVPMTAWLHGRWGAWVVVLGGGLLLGLDALRLAGAAPLAALTTALVWLLCHQLGYLWRDGTLGGRRRAVLLGGAAVGGLVLLTGPGPYAPSMVASAVHPSNMLPTTPPVVLVCLLQLALVLVAGPALARLVRRPRCWLSVVAVNSVAMSIYLWHMPAVLLLVIVAEHSLGPLPAQPDAVWWWSRPAWLGAVVLVLLGMVAVVRRWEAVRLRAPRQLSGTPAAVDPDDHGSTERRRV